MAFWAKQGVRRVGGGKGGREEEGKGEENGGLEREERGVGQDSKGKEGVGKQISGKREKIGQNKEQEGG